MLNPCVFFVIYYLLLVMINIVKFYQAALNRVRSGTTGYFTMPVFIDTTNQEQYTAIRILSRFFETNQEVKDALATLVQDFTLATSSAGLLTKPNNYVRFIAVERVEGKSAYPINTNEISIMENSTIRRPNKAKGLIYYYHKNNNIYFLPKEILTVEGLYIKKPQDVVISATQVSNADSDYLSINTNPNSHTNLEWPEEMFDFLLCLVLSKLGFDLKDELTMQWANLGISMEQVQTEPKP